MSAWAQAPFQAFGATHGVIGAAAIAVCLGCGLVARREAERGRRVFADGFAGVTLGWNLLANGWWVLPANWDAGTSLPLHVCDLANLLIPVAIWTRARWLLAWCVFWGLGLSTQAFVTPTVDEAPGDLRFWLFWGGHLWIAAGCCVIAGGTGYRTTRRDWMMVNLISLAVLGVLLIVNAMLGTNYGYVGADKPASRTIIDWLGSWPMRVVWLYLIACAAHGLVLLGYPLLRVLLGAGTVRSAGDAGR